MAHALIVGAGLVGLLTARELRARGFDVTVIERGEVGREASWAGGGILSPLYPWRFPDAVTALTMRSLDLWPALAGTLLTRTGIDPEYRVTGLLAVNRDDPAEVTAWARRHGVDIEHLDPAVAAAQEPAAHLPAGHAFHMRAVGQVRNPRLLRAARALVVGEGVTLCPHTEVTALLSAAGRITGVRTSAGDVAADAVVLCTGAWTAGLLDGLGATPPPIEPVRGQILAFAATPGTMRGILLAGAHYLIPRGEGLILAGSTIERAGFERTTTAAARAELAAFATDLLPPLRDVEIVAHWSGLRPGTPDGVPTIDRHPSIEGLWLNAGHFRNGIVTAPASAELAAERIAGEEPGLDPAPYAWPPEL